MVGLQRHKLSHWRFVMCGIVGAIAERNVSAILLEGLKRLEYRGYDSAGMAVYTNNSNCSACVAPVKSQNFGTSLTNRTTQRPKSASPTPAGPPTVYPAKPMPIRISPAQTWRLYTTASLKTIKNCAASCKLRVMFSLHRLTPKPSSTCCIICKNSS